jgi:Gpi18-like mannosyltransferase
MGVLLNKIKSFLKEYRDPLAIFIASRVMVFLILLLVIAYGIGDSQTIYGWDAKHYLSIAENGYMHNGLHDITDSRIAFFPLYPVAISIFHIATGFDYGISGLILTLLFGLGAAILLYRLVFDWKGREAAITAVSLFSFFPVSVFLSSTYTESLFMFLSLAAFYFLKQKREVYAIIAVALSTVTRITGSILGLVYIWDVWKRTKSIFIVIGYGLIISIPFVLFLYFQFVQYGTPFAFLDAQKAFWYSHAVFPWTGLSMFLENVFIGKNDLAMWWTNFIFLFVMVVALSVSFRKVPRDIWFFGLGIILLSLSNSFPMSMERFMIPVLPFYFYFGDVLSRHKLAKDIVLSLSIAWMAMNTVIFITGNLFL